MIRLMLIALVLFPLLRTESVRSNEVISVESGGAAQAPRYPLSRYQAETDAASPSVKSGRNLTEEEYAELIQRLYSHLRPSPPSSDADREAQRAEAIEAQDPALLPLCTDEDYALHNSSDTVPAKSYEPWKHLDQLGCHIPPPIWEQVVWGPPSEAGKAR